MPPIAATAADAVRAIFIAWSATLEGRCPFMYLDMHTNPVTKKLHPLVTCGVGNLIDPKALALRLPWRRNTDGQLATQAEVRAEWEQVKARVDLAPKGIKSRRAITTLHLNDAAIDALILAHFDSDAMILRRRFTGMVNWPADAVLGVHSMAWGMGAAFPRKYPRFSAACDRMDFGIAADECTSPQFNGDRNTANVLLFLNAAHVIREGLDRSTLLWVGDAHAPQPPR